MHAWKRFLHAALTHDKVDDTDDVIVVGARARFFDDFYHAFLLAKWRNALAIIVAAFLLLNVAFACVYLWIGGVANAQPRSFGDAFFFSVHTLATLGYGSMYPTTLAAHWVVVLEAVVGMLFTALSTGLVFAKFSTTAARVQFASHAVLFPMNGVPTLAFRVGNGRSNAVVECNVHVTLARTERTSEGMLFYRMLDLGLHRHRAPVLARNWTVMHTVDATSPLYQLTPEDCQTQEIELMISVSGIDETTLQTVLARRRYLTHEILFGARHRDALRVLPTGKVELDVRLFDQVVATEPSDTFPYRWEDSKPSL